MYGYQSFQLSTIQYIKNQPLLFRSLSTEVDISQEMNESAITTLQPLS